MIDKKLRKATLQHCGPVLAIRMTGGPDCLWLHMYLDTETWQMTCDSDIGSYAYMWGRSYGRDDDFIEFCSRWLADENWLLRKCVGENHIPISFNIAKTGAGIRQRFIEYNGEEADTDDLEEAFGEAAGYSQSAEAWSAAFCVACDVRHVDLPDDWFEDIATHYTPQQKRFAEICREVIVPELKKLVEGERRLLNDC